MKKSIISAIAVSMLSFAVCAEETSAAPVVSLDMVKSAENTVKNLAADGQSGTIRNPQFVTETEAPEGLKALFFDAVKGVAAAKRRGGSVITLTGMKKYDFSKGLSLMFWYKLDPAFPDPTKQEVISSVSSELGPGFRLYYDYKRWNFMSGDGKQRKVLFSSKGRNAITKGTWAHAAVVCDGKNATIYMDGEVAAKSVPGEEFPIFNGSDYLTVGGYDRGYYYYFGGALAGVKIYNRALSPAEIVQEAGVLE